MENVQMAVDFVMAHQAAILAGLALLLSELLALNPNAKSNGLIQLGLNLVKRSGVVIPGALFLLSGCVTINNSALSGEKNAVKTDADAQQTVSPNTTATVPLR